MYISINIYICGSIQEVTFCGSHPAPLPESYQTLVDPPFKMGVLGICLLFKGHNFGYAYFRCVKLKFNTEFTELLI